MFPIFHSPYHYNIMIPSINNCIHLFMILRQNLFPPKHRTRYGQEGPTHSTLAPTQHSLSAQLTVHLQAGWGHDDTRAPSHDSSLTPNGPNHTRDRLCEARPRNLRSPPLSPFVQPYRSAESLCLYSQNNSCYQPP